MYTILLVDDEDEVRRSIKELTPWEEYGFSVIGEASNGMEALDALEETMPDVIITDIKMPYLDGISFIEEVRRNRSTSVDVIILSGYDETTEAEYELVCSLPELSYRCCAFAVLEDMGILESGRLNDDTRNGKTALYQYLQELSSMPGKFDAKAMYLLDLAAKCLEPFVSGQIHFTKPYEICYAPGYLAKKFQKMLDSFDEDLPDSA